MEGGVRVIYLTKRVNAGARSRPTNTRTAVNNAKLPA
jgi:hypothetical protein